MHRGWARYCNRGFGWLFRLVPLSWHCWEWLTLCWLRSLEFLWRGCHIRGLQGYRSLARSWAVEWLISAPAEMSAVSLEDSPMFCLHFIGSHSASSSISALNHVWLLSCGSGITLSPLSPMVRAPWRWVCVRLRTVFYFSLQSYCMRNLSTRAARPVVAKNEGVSRRRKNKRLLTLFCLGTTKLSR